MRKLLGSILALSILILSPAYVLAQRNAEDLRQQAQERREMVQERRQEIMERVEERRTTREARLTEARQQRIRFFWGRLKRRLMAAMDRLELLIERIESRLAKFEENNPDLDTSGVHQDLDEAKELLAAAQAECEAIDATIDEILNSDDPTAAFEVVRTSIMEIKMDLIEIHRMLVSIIGDIRGLRVGNGLE